MSITPPQNIICGALEEIGVHPVGDNGGPVGYEALAAAILEELRAEWDLHPVQVPWGGNSAVIRQESAEGWSVVVNGIDIAGWIDDWSITPEPETNGAGTARLNVSIPVEYLDMRAEGTR